MGLIVVPERRIVQPKHAAGVNRANPLTRGLGYLYNCSLPKPRNLVSPLDELIGTTQNGRVPYGSTLAADVGNYTPLYVQSPGIAFASGADFTIVARVPYASLSGGNPGIVRAGTGSLAVGTAGTGTTFFIFQGSGSYRPWLRLNGTDAFKPTTGPQLSVGNAYTIAIAVRSGVGVSVAWDGAIQHIGTFATAVPAWAASYLGCQNNNTERVGPVGAVAVWPGRALADAELREITRENAIWSLFQDDGISFEVVDASGDLNITASLGTASATGYTATVDRQRTIAASLGTATAQGYGATVNRYRNISASLGTATASGYGATVNRQRDIAASLGAATAQGYGATISFGNDLTIAASLGLASADGYQANVNLRRDIAASLGTAAALGYQASISDTDPLHGFTQDQLDFLVAYMEAAMAIPTALEIAAAVRSELASELTRISDLAKRGGVVSGTSVVIPPGDGSIVAGDVEIDVSTAEDGTVTLARV